jgi:hypothetical protein
MTFLYYQLKFIYEYYHEKCVTVSYCLKIILGRIHDEWLGRGTFLGRGNFVETLMALAEVAIGINILIIGEAGSKYSILLDKFDVTFANWNIGLAWLITGLLSLSGIILYICGYRTVSGYTIERLLRFLGALASVFIWLWAGFTLMPSPYMHAYFAMAIGAMRVTRIVWRDVG